MDQFLVYLSNIFLNLFFFTNLDYLVTDLFIIINILLCILVYIYFFNLLNPFCLIIVLELMYFFININFLLSWLFFNFFNGIIYCLIIIGISGAETIIGLILIVHLYNTKIDSFTYTKTLYLKYSD